ncbi:M56 family metallopeptidase [Aquaticitalea lipolytica]|nr:M56 family metallopeptidase [Aquaticitalea lipolytica]
MLIYILKFSACLFIFMAFYKLFLERETMHQLKRFYLLFALVLSIGFPLITFTQFVEPVTITQNFTNAQQIVFEHEAIEQTSLWDYLPQLLWTVYGIGVLIFSLKFVLNLNVIFKKIHCNPKLKAHRYINVLLNDEVTPHTFFNYIFLNKYKYESQQIPQEVFIHEQTHAEQKHSLDILFIELLQILFWFNPLLYFIKRDIKLNHEFLADKAVLLNGIQPSQYQQLLLAFSSNAAEPQLANAINYSSIKKRFTIMKTQTSKQKMWLRSLLLLPLVALTLYGFSERKEVVNGEILTSLEIIETLDLFLNENGELLLNDKVVTLLEIKNLFQQNKNLQVSVKIYPDANKEIKDNIFSDLRTIGIKKITICTSQVDEFLNQQKATPEEVAEYNKLAKKYNAQPKEKRVVKLDDLKRLEYIYNKMSKDQKASSEPFPDCPPPPPAPKVIKGKELPPPPPIPADATPTQKKKMQNAVDDYNNKVPPPPPPPAPKSPLDHVIEMAKKGASFYYEGKSISSDEAISLLKKNDKLNISTKESNSKQPKVYITTKPIVIKN